MSEAVKLLVVDDEAPFVRTVSDFLSRVCGYKVSVAFDGRQASQRLKEDQPAIALLDLKLPDFNGQDLIRQAQQVSPHTKIIVLTAYRDEALQDRLLKEPGVVGFMFKPLSSLLDLEKKIKEAL